MKKIVLLILMCVQLSYPFAQKDTSNDNKKHTNIEIYPPKLIEKENFLKEFKKLNSLNEIYDYLKKDTSGAVFQYSIGINSKGNVNLVRRDNTTFLLKLNDFVEKRLKQYQWIPARKTNCKECFVNSKGVFIVNFSTVRKEIKCYIEIYLPHKREIVFMETLKMNR